MTTQPKPDVFEKFVGFVVAVSGSLLRCWLCSIVWRWFVVTAFSLPEITTLQVFALNGLAVLLLPSLTKATSPDWDTREKLWTSVLTTPATSLFVFAILWLVKISQ